MADNKDNDNTAENKDKATASVSTQFGKCLASNIPQSLIKNVASHLKEHSISSRRSKTQTLNILLT